MPTSKMKSASILQTIMRTFVVQEVKVNSVGVRPEGDVNQPDVSEFDLAAFTRAGEMAALGDATAGESIPQLLRLTPLPHLAVRLADRTTRLVIEM